MSILLSKTTLIDGLFVVFFVFRLSSTILFQTFILLIGPCVLYAIILPVLSWKWYENFFTFLYHCLVFEYFYNYFLYLVKIFSFSRSLQKRLPLNATAPFPLSFHYLNGCSCVYGFIITNFEIYNRTFFLFLCLYFTFY